MINIKKLLAVGIILLFTGVAVGQSITANLPNKSSISQKLSNDWIYNEDTDTYSIEFSGLLNESFVKSFSIAHLYQYKVAVIFSHEYSFPHYDDGEHVYDSKGYVEVSYDSGETWKVLAVFEGNTSQSVRDFYITLTTHSLWVKFTVEGIGDSFTSEQGGYWRVRNIDLIGDTGGTPPYSWVLVQGPCVWTYWHSFPIHLTIGANDGESGVREIHYVLNRQETVTPGDTISFIISTNGIHHLAFWAVDNCGNEEIPNIIPPFGLDREAPHIDIKSPETGLYIFGNKIPLSIDKIIIVGGFNIEATAYDNVSGVYRVRFYLDGDCINTATEESYSRYCGIRHWGKGTIKVIIQDFAGNCAEDSLDVFYYNLW